MRPALPPERPARLLSRPDRRLGHFSNYVPRQTPDGSCVRAHMCTRNAGLAKLDGVWISTRASGLMTWDRIESLQVNFARASTDLIDSTSRARTNLLFVNDVRVERYHA